MNRNLNPQEFGEQLGLFDAVDYTQHGPAAPVTKSAPESYPDPHASDPSSPLQEEVPDFGPEGGMWDRGSSSRVLATDFLRAKRSDWKETIVPTWDLRTSQGSVYRPSIEHLKKNPESWPNVRTVGVRGERHLIDGNHRALAAKELGKLFVFTDEYSGS